MVIHHYHTTILYLDQNLARRCQDSEVGDGGLRREAKSLRKLLFEGVLDRVELAVLCAAAGSNQVVVNPINLNPCQRLLNAGLLAQIQRFRWHINCGNVNFRIEPLQEAISELPFPTQIHGLL